jgi:hypothetical protein
MTAADVDGPSSVLEMVINTWENVAYKHLPNSAKQGYS